METGLAVAGMLSATVLAVLVIGRLAGRAVLARRVARARAALPVFAQGDLEDRAVSLTAPYQGYGLLRLTDDDLMFANVSGEVLSVPRRSIAACLASDDVPIGAGMRTLPRPALVLQINDPTLPQGMGFVVGDPAQWVQRLRLPPQD